jgi:hypothetical protein
MNKTILALSLVAALAACNRGPANNVAGAAGNAAGNGAGLATPPERPAQTGQQAGLPPGLDCVKNRLSVEERRAAAQVAMEQGSRDDPRAQPLMQAVDACTAELNWSPQKRRLAGMFSLSAAGVAGVRELLAGRGINVDELDQAIITDTELMAAAEAGQLGGGTAGQQFALRHLELIQRLTAGHEDDQELGTRIGNYIAFRALAEATARQYGREP